MKHSIHRGMGFAVAILLLGAAPLIAGTDKEDTVKRGAALGESPTVTLAEVVEAPQEFVDKDVIVQGTVAEVCAKKGCWMEIQAVADGPTVRVTFKDYGFFVPKDAHGMNARMEGRFEIKVLSKEDADHLEGDGANVVRNADGTATEIAFVATGVELTAPAKPKTAPAQES